MANKAAGKKAAKQSDKSKKSSAAKITARSGDFLGLPLAGWLSQKAKPAAEAAKDIKKGATAPDIHGRIVLVSSEVSATLNLEALGLDEAAFPGWQWARVVRRRGEVAMMLTGEGPLWLLQLQATKTAVVHGGLLDASAFAQARDLVGQAAIMAIDYGLASLTVEGLKISREEQRGALVGLELASYRFKAARQKDLSRVRPPVELSGFADDVAAEASALGVATNIARHLVNLPAGDLNPTSYSTALEKLFAGSKTMSVEIWQGKKLVQERCNLLHAVGRAAPEQAALVRLSYRPKGKTRQAKPLAFVGKGVTFDTGGIDLKDADSMRLMKKDMGGSATLAGLAYYLESAAVDLACDIYLALAENSIDGNAFRPGDVITARNGQTVEIHNTDAEGRLVLADAIDVALTRQGADAPFALIDVATLTGAMRIALGTRVAGLFANDDVLAEQLLAAAQKAGDPCWRMPLVKEYGAQLRTVFADVANASQGRFGGAITAALFLQRFVGTARWAHLDLYAWGEGGVGGLAEPGGSGQGVQGLARFVEDL